MSLTAAVWSKSTYSEANAQCVEVAVVPGLVGVRDSKQHATGPVLTFSPTAWTEFVGRIRAGEFDLR